MSQTHPNGAESESPTYEPEEDVPEISDEELGKPNARTHTAFSSWRAPSNDSVDENDPTLVSIRDNNWIGIPPLYHRTDPYTHPHLRLAARPRSPGQEGTGIRINYESYNSERWPIPQDRCIQSDFGSVAEDDVEEDDTAWKPMPAHLLPFVPYIEKPTDATSASTMPRRTKHIHIETIQNWLQACEKQHGSQCHSDVQFDQKTHLGRPLYLIDVLQDCLVEAPEYSRYVALSYVWGKSDPAACTTSSNLEELLKPGALRQQTAPMPSTITDAMQLIERLGERYLWCDRYCIVQDDSEAKYRQLATMGKVYAGSFFTLVAAQNNDASLGLFGTRRQMMDPSDTLAKHIAIHTAQSSVTGDQIMLDQALDLMRTKWFSRGWTFQENLFSTRKLVFHDDTVNWECCSAAWHEAQNLAVTLAQTPSCPPRLSVNSFGHPRWPDMLRYSRLVSLFNERDLTFPEDIFDAFGGCLQHLSSAFSGGFISGLPVLCFDAALLWQPWTPMTRRKARKPGCDAYLPSWSWGGWDGVLQSECWRSAANYQFTKDQDTEDSQQCSWRTVRTVQWYYSDTVYSDRLPIHVPRQTAQPDLTTPSTKDLPSGWSCSPSSADRSVPLFYHSCDPSQPFMYPIPIVDLQTPSQPVVNARYLHCTTRRGYLKLGKALPRWSSNCPAVTLKTTFGRWAGVLRFPCKDDELATLMKQGRMELIEISAGSVMNQKIEERSFDEWNVSSCPRYKGLYEFVNVLWIEWRGDVAYRKALGRVKKSAWRRLNKDKINVTLG